MPNEDLANALRSLDAPYFLDGPGVEGPLGTSHDATAHDGRRVTVVQLDQRVVAAMREVDPFVRALRARAHRSLQHGSFVEAGVTPGGGVFIVGTRVDGMSLADRIRSGATFSSDALRQIAIRCATLLDEYCAVDACHGLVMPETIVVGDHDEVTLRWGGLFPALRMSGISPSDISRLLGFNSYIAPELLDGRAEDVRTDVYSLGATLYEALTGRPPFGGRTTSTVMAAVLAVDDATQQSSSSDVFRTAVLRAIERDPHDRWQDGAQFRSALQSVALATPSAAAARSGCSNTLVLALVALVIWGVFS